MHSEGLGGEPSGQAQAQAHAPPPPPPAVPQQPDAAPGQAAAANPEQPAAAAAPDPEQPAATQPLYLGAITGPALTFNRAPPGSGLEPSFIANVRVALEHMPRAPAARLVVRDGKGQELAALERHAAAEAAVSAPCEVPKDQALQLHMWDSQAGWWLLFPDGHLAQAFQTVLLLWRMLNRAAALGFAPQPVAEGGPLAFAALPPGVVAAPAPVAAPAAPTPAARPPWLAPAPAQQQQLPEQQAQPTAQPQQRKQGERALGQPQHSLLPVGGLFGRSQLGASSVASAPRAGSSARDPMLGQLLSLLAASVEAQPASSQQQAQPQAQQQQGGADPAALQAAMAERRAAAAQRGAYFEQLLPPTSCTSSQQLSEQMQLPPLRRPQEAGGPQPWSAVPVPAPTLRPSAQPGQQQPGVDASGWASGQ